MPQNTKKITSSLEARKNKLQNKRNQLENLLRSRERLDYEINNLKKSISKDRKKVLKEETLLSQSFKENDLSIYLEASNLEREEDQDDHELRFQLTEFYNSLSHELYEILELLLKYDEA